MKRQVTIETVKSRVNELERYMADGVISLGEEFELACLRRMLELEARYAALAAENAGLKAENAEGCKWDGEQWVGLSIETPATDAFLAEVRAQGVEMFSEKFGGGTLLSNMVKETAKEFAAQLRKGVQS